MEEPIPAPPVQRLLYSPAEAAAALDVSVKTLLAEVRAGKLRFVRVRKGRKFDPEDLKAYVRDNKVAWPSANGRTPRSTRSTSPSTVIGFDAALARSKKKTPSFSTDS